MVFWKKTKVCLVAVFMLVLATMPCFAVDQDPLITLEEAKELAGNHARALNTVRLTQNRLGVEAEVAYDTYMSNNLTNNITGYKQRILMLYEELSDLDPATDMERINEIQGKIEIYETNISTIRANMPDESLLKPYKLQWRSLDEAHQDMTQIIENTEKSIESAVEQMYYALLDLQSTIETQNSNLSLLGKQLQIERLKIQLGLSNKENEDAIISQYNMLKSMLADLDRNEDLLIWQLNDIMGRELDDPLQLVEGNVVPVKTFYTVDSIYEKAIQESLSIAQKKREIKNYDSDLAKEQNRDQRDILKQGKKIAENELIDLQVGLKEKIKSINDKLTASYTAWETAVTEKARAKLSYNNNEVKYKLGLIPAIMRDMSEIAYMEAVNNEKQTARAWQIAHNQLVLAEAGIVQ